jgi:hypothetical protein
VNNQIVFAALPALRSGDTCALYSEFAKLTGKDVHHVDVCKMCFGALDVEISEELGVVGDGESLYIDSESGEDPEGEKEKENEEEKARQRAAYLRDVRNNWLSAAREFE